MKTDYTCDFCKKEYNPYSNLRKQGTHICFSRAYEQSIVNKANNQNLKSILETNMTKQNIIDKIRESGAVPEKIEKVYESDDKFVDFSLKNSRKYYNLALSQIDLSEIIDIVVEEVRNETADKVKKKFNGYGGILGFTKKNILQLLNNIK